MKHLLLFSLLIINHISWSQEEMETMIEIHPSVRVRAVIDSLFLGMKNGDSSMVSNVFHSELSMKTSFITKNGGIKLVTDSPGDFLKAVGTPHEEVWDERISNVVIQVDDNLAQVWMDYNFYVNDNFSHCGVNAMQLVNTDNGWKILNLIDTRRKKNCEE